MLCPPEEIVSSQTCAVEGPSMIELRAKSCGPAGFSLSASPASAGPPAKLLATVELARFTNEPAPSTWMPPPRAPASSARLPWTVRL